MGIIRPQKPFIYNTNRMLPANIYSKPAAPTMYSGVMGYGQASKYNAQQFQYTMEQMAASPFAVNSAEYMDRVRDEYGYNSTGMYDAFGVMGAGVGAGVGVLARGGWLQSPLSVKGELFKPDTWGIEKQNPWIGNGYNNKHYEQRQNRVARSELKRNVLFEYNQSVEALDEAKNRLNAIETNLKDAKKRLAEAKELERKTKYGTKKIDPRRLEVAREVKKAESVVRDLEDSIKTSRKILTKSTNTFNNTAEVLKTVNKGRKITKAIEEGVTISARLAGLAPGATGLALDTAGLAMDVAGFTMALEQGDVLMGALSGIGAIAGVLDVAGNALAMTGAGPAAGFGAGLSVAAGVVSLGVSAIQGALVGTTIGRSMSPEGARAQQMFSANLYSGMVHRPISTIGSLATLVGTPIVLGNMGSNGKGVASWLTRSALGNQVRAGLNMAAMQVVNSVTAPIDEMISPADPENVNFVSAISLYGDINDNLYGATKNKAILVGLAANDPNAMTQALARSWGMGDDIYRSVMFDDVREAAGIDAGSLGNSIISILGELVIDPQNMFEMDMKSSTDTLASIAARDITKAVEVESIKRQVSPRKANPDFEALTGPDGLLTRNTDVANRTNFVKQLIEAYLTDGRKGLIKKLADSSQKGYKGAKGDGKSGGMVSTIVPTKYVDNLIKVFDNTLNGRTIYNGVDPQLKARTRKMFNRYLKLQKINPAEYNKRDINLIERIKYTGDQLEKLYGKNDIDVLFNKFMEDFDIKLGREEYGKLYNTSQNIRHHMDMADALAGVVTTVSNPTLKMAQHGTEGLRKFIERTRYKSSAQKQMSIIKLKDIMSNKDKIKTVDDVKEAAKAADEKYKEKSLDDVFDYVREDSTVRIEQRAEFVEQDKQNVEEYKQRKEQHTLAVKHYDDEMARLEKNRKETIYWTRNYESKRGNTYHINGKNLKKYEDNLTKLGESLGITKEMTYEEVEARLRELRNSGVDSTIEAANKYADLRDAILDYQYVNVYYEVTKDILSTIKSAITLLDLPSTSVMNSEFDLLELQHVFTQLTNTVKTTKRSEGLIALRAKLRKRYKKLSDNIKANKKLEAEYEQVIAKEVELRKDERPGTLTETEYREIQEKLTETRELIAKDRKRRDKIKTARDEANNTVKQIKGTAQDVDVTSPAFDVDNYLLFKDSDKLKSLDRVLMYYGFSIEVVVDGQPVRVKSLSEIAANKLHMKAPLQFRRETTVEQAIQSHIFHMLSGYDIDAFLQGLVSMPKDFVKKWRNAKGIANEQGKKNEMLIELLSSLDLTAEQFAHLISEPARLIALRETINTFTLAGDTRIDYVQASDLDRKTIRAIVMADLLNSKKVETNLVHAALEQFRAANKYIEELKQTREYKDSEYLKDVLRKQIGTLNMMMHKNTTFKFLKAYLSPGVKKEVGTGLFLSGSLHESLPKKLWDSYKERLKKTNEVHKIKDELLGFADNEMTKQFIEMNREAFERSKRLRKAREQDEEGNIIPTEDDVIIREEVAKIRSVREDNKARVDSIKNTHQKEASAKTDGLVDDVTKEDTDILGMVSDIGTDRFFNLKLVKSIQAQLGYGKSKRLNRNQKKQIISAFIVRALQEDGLRDIRLDQIILTMTPTQYKYGDKKKRLTYYDVLKKFNRGSSGHTAHVNKVARQIVNTFRNFGGIVTYKDGVIVLEGGPFNIDLKQLQEVKRYGYETAEAHLARRLAVTYLKNPDGVKLYVQFNNRQRWGANYENLTNSYKTALREAVISYMVENFDSSFIKDFDPNTGQYGKTAVDEFIEDLVTGDDPRLIDVRNDIYKRTIDVYNEMVQETHYNRMYYKMLPFMNGLRDYEQKDISQLTGNHYVSTADVFNKLMSANTRMVDLLDDFIKMSGDVEDDEYNTMLAKLISTYNKHINENYDHKRTIQNNKFDGIKVVDPTHNRPARVYFQIKDTKKEISLFDLMYRYDKNLSDMFIIMEKVTKIMSDKGVPEEALTDIRLKVLNQYDKHLEENGGILTRNTFDLAEEMFLDIKNEDGSQKYTSEDYKLMTDIMLNRVYSLLRTKHVLPTEKGASGKEYSRMTKYFNKETFDILEKSEADKEDTTHAFLKRLLKDTKINDHRKKTILKNIFFYEYKVQAGHATTARIKHFEQKAAEATTTRGKVVNQKKADELKSIRENIVNKELEDFDKFYEYLKEDPDRAVRIFANNWSLDNGDYAVVEHDGKYYVVDNNGNHGKNIDQDARVGIPPHNERIGEEIIKNNDNERAERIQRAIKTNEDLPNLKVKASSEVGTVIIVDDNKQFNDYIGEFYRKLNFAQEFGGKLYFVTEKQYKDIAAMAINKTYKDDHVYKAVVTDGEVQGVVRNIIGGKKGVDTLARQYIADIQSLRKVINAIRVRKPQVNTFVRRLANFAKIYETDTVVKKAYVNSVSFDKTDTFLDLARASKLNRAYLKFIHHIDPTKKFDKFNLHLLERLFFREEFITNKKTGELYDLSKLEDVLSSDLKNRQLIKQMKETKIKGKDLYTRTMEALTMLQEEYGTKTNDFDFNINKVFDKKFINNINDLERKVSRILAMMKSRHRDAYKVLVPLLNKHAQRGLITDITVSEIQERNRHYKEVMHEVINTDNEYLLIAPYTPMAGAKNMRSYDERDKLLAKLLENFHADDGMNQTYMNNTFSKMRRKYKNYAKYYNNMKKKGKSDRLDLKYFWQVHNQVRRGGLSAIAGLENFKSLQPLRELAQENYKELVEIEEQLKGDISMFHPDQVASAKVHIDFLRNKRKIKSAVDMENAMIRTLLWYLNENIRNKTQMKDYNVEMLKIVSMFKNLPPEQRDAKIAEHSEALMKYTLDFKPDYTYTEDTRKTFTNRKVKGVDIQEEEYIEMRIEGNYFGLFRLGRGSETTEETVKVLTEFTNEYVDTIYNRAADVKKYDAMLKALVKEDVKDSLNEEVAPGMSVQDYLKTIPPTEVDQDVAWFLVKFYILKQGKPTEEDWAKLNNSLDQTTAEAQAEHLRTKHIKNIYSILRGKSSGKKQVNQFSKPNELYKKLNTPVLNANKEFMQYVRDYFFRSGTQPALITNFLRNFGMTYSNKHIFDNAKNMIELVNDLSRHYYRSESRKGIDEMYLFTMVTNMLKEQFINMKYREGIITKRNTDKDGWSWASVKYYDVTKPLEDAVEGVEILESTGTFSKNEVFESNIKASVKNNVSFINDALAYIKDTNKKLYSIIIPDGTKIDDQYDMKPMNVMVTKNNVSKLAQSEQRDLFKAIFNKETTMAPTSIEYNEYTKLLGDVVLHSIVEDFAPSIKEVGSPSPLYLEIMEKFNDAVMQKRDRHGVKQFVTMKDVTGAFTALEGNKDLVAVYRNVLKKHEATLTKDVDKRKDLYKEAVEKIVELFRDKGYLKTIDSDYVDAVVGRIIYHRFGLKDINIDEVTKEAYDLHMKQLKVRNELAIQRSGKIAYELNAATDIDEIRKILYGDRELTAEEEQYLAETIELKKVMTNDLSIDPDRLYDTYDYAYHDAADTAYEDSTLGSVHLEAYKNYRASVAKRAGLVRSHNSYTKKHSTNMMQATYNYDKALDVVKGLEESVARLTEEVAVINDDVTAIKNEALLRIIEHNPIIMRNVLAEIENRRGEIEAQLKGYKETFTEPLKNGRSIHINLIKYFNEYQAKHNEYLEFRQSYGYELYKQVKQQIEAGQELDNLYNMFAERAKELKINSNRKFKTWFNESTHLFTYKEMITETVHNIKDENNKNLSYATAFKELLKRYNNIVSKEHQLERFNEEVPGSTDDFKTGTKLYHSRKYVAKVVKAYKDVVKENISKVFADEDFALTPETTEYLFNKVSEEIGNQKQYIAKHQDKLQLKYGLSRDLSKLDKNIKEAIDNHTLITGIIRADRYVQGLQKIHKNIKRAQEHINRNKKILGTLQSKKTVTLEEQMLKATEEVFVASGFDMNEENLLNVLEYVSGNTTKEHNTALNNKKGALATAKSKLKEATKYRDELKKYIDQPEQIEAYEKLIEEQKEVSIKARNKYNESKTIRSEKKPHSNSNLGTFRNLYGINTRELALTGVIDLTVDSRGMSREKLLRLIKEAGYDDKANVSLHNPVVDVLITRLNYIKQMEEQGKPLPKTFTVFDMETVEDVRGKKIPYQMTVLKQNADGSIELFNSFFNNYIFNQKDGDRMELDNFYEQQWRMIEKDKEAYEELYGDMDPKDARKLVDKETDKIIKKVTKTKNSIALVNVFINLLNTKDVNDPIVAHNGKRFDFPVYEDFLKDYAGRLLTNMYYQETSKTTPKEMQERLTGTTLEVAVEKGLTDDIVKMYNEEIDKILKKLDDTTTWQEVTKAEKKKLQEFNEAVWSIKALNVWKELEYKYGWTINEDLKEKLLTGKDSEAMKLKADISEYIKAKDKRAVRNKIVNYFIDGFKLTSTKDQTVEIAEYVDNLLTEVTAEFNRLKAGGVMDYNELTVKDSPFAKAMAASKPALTKEEQEQAAKERQFTPADRLQGYLHMIETTSSMIDALEHVDTKTVDTVQYLSEKINKDKTMLDAHKNRIAEINKELDKGMSDAGEILSDIQRLADSIKETTKLPAYRAHMILNNHVKGAVEMYGDVYESQYNTGLLKIEIKQNLDELNNIYGELTRLIELARNYALNKDEATLDEIINMSEVHPDVLGIKTEEDRVKVIEDFTERQDTLRQFISLADADEIKLTPYFEAYIKSLLDEFKSSNAIKELADYVIELWNDPRTKSMFGNIKGYKEFDTIPNIKDDKFYADLHKVVRLGQAHKDNVHYKKLNMALNNRSQIRTLISLDTKTVKDLANLKSVMELVKASINKDINRYSKYIEQAESLEVGTTDKEHIAYSNIQNKFLELMETVHSVDETKKQIDRKDMFNMLSNKGIGTQDMTTYEEFVEAATKTIDDKEYLEALGHGVTRAYDNPMKNDDKWGLGLDEKKKYGTVRKATDGSGEIVTVSMYDEYNDDIQQFTYNTKAPNKVTFKIRYNYAQYGQQFTMKKPKEFTVDTSKPGNTIESNPRTLYKNMFKQTGVSPKNTGIPGLLKTEIYKEDGLTDHSLNSIDRLVTFYEQVVSKQSGRISHKKVKSQVIFDKGDNGLPLRHLKKINITKKFENRFQAYLSATQDMQRIGTFKELSKVYAGLAEKMLGKYNSLEPGKILNMIPKEYSRGFIIDHDEATLDEFGIDILRSSEGSAGTSFMVRNQYTTSVTFRHNTNPIRAVLSNAKGYADWTALKIINDLYKLEDEATVKQDNFMDYVKDQEDWQEGTLKHKYFIETDKNGRKINMFTPNVGTRDMLEKYEEDSLHKKGFNVKIAFSNDTRAYEDTILVDATLARAFGYSEHDKTWLGQYGFKGAVKFVEGLKDDYNGAMFVARAPSIGDRGAYGALNEMAINVIRDYLNGNTDGMDAQRLILLDNHKDRLESEFELLNGKVIIDPNKDINELLIKIFGRTDWETVLLKNSKQFTVTYHDSKHDEKHMAVKGFYEGSVYVILDSEHVASHMARETKVDDTGGIVTVLKDLGDSVRGGVNISPSVAMALESKGVNWLEAFPPTDDAYDLYAEVSNLGLRPLLDRVDPDSKLTEEEILRKLEDLPATNLVKTIQDYLHWYMKLREENTTKEQEYLEYNLARLSNKAQQQALESLHGRNGAMYKSTYKKHPGIRQQFVANTDLALGTVLVSKKGWDALVEMKQGFVVPEDMPLDKWQEITGGIGKNSTKTFKDEQKLKDYIFKLGRYGIVQDYNYTLKDKTIRFINTQRSSGYVLAARSPVQDYNAVPVVKIVGFNSGEATEANQFMYGMMGADNDGDTFGMAALDAKQREALMPNGKGLNATNPEYYDAGYLARVDKEMSDLDDDGLPQELAVFKDKSAIAAFVGKKTFDKIRKKYTWNELYMLTYDGIEDYINSLPIKPTELDFMKGNHDKALKLLSSDESKLKLVQKWVNVIVRHETSGENYNKVFKTTDDYEDVNKLYHYFTKHQDSIIKRYMFDEQVLAEQFNVSAYIKEEDIVNFKKYLSAEDVKALEDIGTTKFDYTKHKDLVNKIAFNKLYSRILHNTIKRIQTSKRGIDSFGGNRKKQLISAYLSDFPNINKDKKGEVWDPYRDDDGNLTVASVADKLFTGVDSIEQLVELASGEETNVLERYKKFKDFKNYVPKPAGLHKYISADYDRLLEFIYKQFVNASQVEKELLALREGIYYKDPNRLIEVLKGTDKYEVDPNIRYMLQRWERDVKEGKKTYENIVTAVDMEWLQIAYFGRNRTVAKDLFKKMGYYNDESIAKAIKEQADGYINQYIIDRKRLGVMSDEATKIIAVAKHHGIDTNSVKFIDNFTTKLEQISEEINIRKVTIGDDYRLNTAVAMDADIFMNNGIKHKDKYVTDMRDTYKDKYDVENYMVDVNKARSGYQQASKHVDDLIISNAKVELFADPFIPDKYYKEVRDAIEEMFKILTDIGDIYNLKDSDALNESIKTLTRYGIPSYRVQRVLLNSIATFRRVNTIYYSKDSKSLSFKDRPFLNGSLVFYETATKLYNKQEQARFKATFEDNKLLSNFFLNSLEVDPSLLVVDGDGVKNQESDNIDVLNFVINRSHDQEQLGNLQKDLDISDTVYQDPKLNVMEQYITRQMLKRLELIGTGNTPTFRSSMEDSIKQFSKIHNIYEYKQGLLGDNRYKYKSRESIENEMISRGIFNYANIVGSVDTVTQRFNDYQALVIEKNKLDAERIKLDANIIALTSQREKYEGQRKYFEQYTDKQVLIDDLKTLRNEYQDKINTVEEQMMDFAFSSKFDGVILLHNQGQNMSDYYFTKPDELSKEITDDTVKELQNTNVVNMHKYQQPFMHKAALFVKPQFSDRKYHTTGMYDWDLFYEWYKVQTRFHRLTVVMNAFEDETLLKQLHHFAKKEDLEYEKLTQRQRKKLKHVVKHYKKSRFKTKEDLIDFMKQLEVDSDLKDKLVKVKSLNEFNKVMDSIDINKYSDKFQEAIDKVVDQDSLEKLIVDLEANKIVTRLRLNNEVYSKVDLTKDDDGNYELLNKGEFLTPTLKEIDINSAEDLKTVFQFIKKHGDKHLIGFTDLDSWMEGMEQAYRPHRLEGKLADIVTYLQFAQKLLMRLNPAFLVRNEIDTWVQIFSETQMQQGSLGMLLNTRTIANYVGTTHKIYSVYKAINEERLLTLMDINLRYTDISRLLDKRTPGTVTVEDVRVIEEIVSTFRERMQTYVDVAHDLKEDEQTLRIKGRAKRGEQIIKQLDDTLNHIRNNAVKEPNKIYDIVKRKDILHSVEFLMNLRFAEYYTMYDDLRVDPSAGRSRDGMFNGIKDWHNNRYKRKIKKVQDSFKDTQAFNHDDFKNILFEISRFMQTNAQVDAYKQESFRYIYDGINQQKQLDNSDHDLSYEQLLSVVAEAKRTVTSDITHIMKNPVTWSSVQTAALLPARATLGTAYKVYDQFNSDIENIGRVAGYLFDRHMYGYTFEESVNRSLRRFFNYGQRSATEMRLLADIPYLSFPVRSIDNWIDRVNSPSYLRVMSDIIDGAYGQYADDDGQYDDFTKFQMANGWLPLFGNVGIRMGWGALDLQALLSDTSGEMQQRTNPLLRGISALAQGEDVVTASKNLATVGAISKAATTLAPREKVRGSALVKDQPRGLHNTFGFLYGHNTYEKYTPKKYKRQNTNNRYKRYENIYRNWFNKYGRMRVPKVDPLTLVKDIQWKQYVRHRQSQAMNRW